MIVRTRRPGAGGGGTIRNLWRVQTDIQLEVKRKVEGNDINTEKIVRILTSGT